MVDILSQHEKDTYNNSAELSQLSTQDFLQLKSSLYVLGYYDPSGQLDITPNRTSNFADAYENLKSDLSSGDQNNKTSLSQYYEMGAYARKIGEIYEKQGIDIDSSGAREVNEMARVMVASAGGMNMDGLSNDRIIRENIMDLAKNAIFTDTNEQTVSMFQGVMKSLGVTAPNGSKLAITGELDPETEAASNALAQDLSAYFTADEKLGVSGSLWSEKHTSGIRADNTFGDDDFSLTNDYTFDDSIMFLDSMNLDSIASELNTAQLKMLQGVANIVLDEDLVLDGIDGTNTQAAVEQLFQSHSMQHYLSRFDNISEEHLSVENGLNSHHFEMIRNWANNAYVTSVDYDPGRNTITNAMKDALENETLGTALNPVYNEQVANAQAALNIMGYNTTVDGLYGGETTLNISKLENEKVAIDPDQQFVRFSSGIKHAMPGSGTN